jgi:hypothetical protein
VSRVVQRFFLVAAVCVTIPFAVAESARASDPAIVTVYPVAQARGVLATSGGWAYCLQTRDLARRYHYTLVCGRYYRDGYTGYGLRSRRFLDWGDPAYLTSLAARIAAVHARVGGDLVLLGVSYAGFDVATLASHHTELRPNRLIVLDSYLDLVARRAAAGSNGTAAEIDDATGGSPATLRAQSVNVSGLARLVREGTQLIVVWSIAPQERREFNGATCNASANADDLAQLATMLGRPIRAWVTESRHGEDLWDSGRRLLSAIPLPPGREVAFEPRGALPAGSTC